jgi:hypothetical protein
MTKPIFNQSKQRQQSIIYNTNSTFELKMCVMQIFTQGNSLKHLNMWIDW